MRKLNWDKELRKVQKRGLYNPKIRVFSIIAIAVLTLGIGLTFSAFSYSSGDSQAFSSTVTKKVNITLKTTNGYPSTLAGKILSDNEVKENPNFSSSHTDKGLYVQKGDSTKSVGGKPTYYYRGEVTNNYLSFAGMTWRIVRINEDGTIRLISANEYHNDDIGNLYSTTNANYSTSQVKEAVDAWYNELSADNKKYIATGKFCNDTTNTASSRLSSNPTFVCPSGANYLSLNAGIITADELRYAGSANGGYAPSFINNGWNWTMTQASSTSMYIALSNGVWNHYSAINVDTRYHRYVINLKAEALYKSGEGTSSSPYVVEGLASSTDAYTKESRYNKATDIYVFPHEGYTYESVSCDNNQTATYDNNTHKLTISAKKDTTCTVKFKEKPTDLKSVILADNTLKTTTPDFSIGEPPFSGTNTGSGLYKMADDDGESYYFRGAIENNYVKFANKDWRIIRVNGDQTIRISLVNSIGRSKYNENSNDRKYSGYTYDNPIICTKANPCTTNSGTSSVIKTVLENWYNNNLAAYDDYIVTSGFCNDTSYRIDGPYYYGAYDRTFADGENAGKPILTCPTTSETYGGYYKLKIGLLTIDEYMLSGIGFLGQSAGDAFLAAQNTDSGQMSMSAGYMLDGKVLTLIIDIGDVTDLTVGETVPVSPVINLKSDVTISSGNGTKDNPYVIE